MAREMVAALLALALVACDRTPAQPPVPSTSPAPIAKLNEGAGLMGMFQFEDAEKVFAEVVRAHPDNRDAKLDLAISILNQTSEGAQERALALLQGLIDRDLSDLNAHYCAGIVQLFLGSPEEALKHFEVASSADPNDAYAAYYAGQCFEFAGRKEEALAKYKLAAELDSYLRSPHLGAQRVLARLGREDEAAQALKDYLALDGNPRGRIVEFKYTRMGMKSEVALPLSATSAVPTTKPPFFNEVDLTIDGDPQWSLGMRSITVADIDGDGELDLFAACGLRDGTNAVLLAVKGSPNHYRLVRDHPLASIPDVRAALWGDLDNDGRVDVYLCRKGANELWLNPAAGWKDVSESSRTSSGVLDTIDGVLADLDHDGDLDIYLVNADGPCELLSNNSDGTFRAIGKDSGAIGDGRPARCAVVADFDGDRDADIYLVHDAPPNELLLNDRLWRYERAKTAPAEKDALSGAVAGDLDADGRIELVALTDLGVAIERERDGAWSTSAMAALDARSLEVMPRPDPAKPAPVPFRSVALFDIDGTGRPAIVARWFDIFAAYDATCKDLDSVVLPKMYSGEACVPLVGSDRGAAIVVLESKRPLILQPTANRGNFLTLSLHGRIDPAQAMRSNASGIGARIVVRCGDTWSIVDTFKNSTGPGQSLQPIAIGLGSATKADFIAIEWSDGVMQTEMNLAAGKVHNITETQRQISSCPVIFAWDGSSFQFVTDCLGVGGIGYLIGVERGTDGKLVPQYAPPRPWEHVLLPESIALVARDGALELRLAEPMEEALYLDAARLVAYDVPPGWSLTIDERMGLADPQPTGEVRAYRRALVPKPAHAEPRDVDPRFIGMLRAPETITLEFDEAIDAQPGATLVAHGWIEYPYCQTNFAAWQAGKSYDAPDLEARGSDGTWTKVLGPWGYPAGMPREMSLPLANLPRGTTALRMTSNQEIYWDSFAVVWSEPCAELARTELALVSASAHDSGFQQRNPGKRPSYEYGKRPPFWATRHQPGFYTAFGACDELLRDADSALAIIGPGEEIRLRFAPPSAPLREDWTRRYVLELDGWCKDMDLFTGDGDTLGPLPMGDVVTPIRDALHAKFNTRWRDGY